MAECLRGPDRRRGKQCGQRDSEHNGAHAPARADREHDGARAADRDHERSCPRQLPAPFVEHDQLGDGTTGDRERRDHPRAAAAREDQPDAGTDQPGG